MENLDKSNQFALGRDFIRNFCVPVGLNNALFRIRSTERKSAAKPVNLITTQEFKAPVFMSRWARLKANDAAIVSLSMRKYK